MARTVSMPYLLLIFLMAFEVPGMKGACICVMVWVCVGVMRKCSLALGMSMRFLEGASFSVFAICDFCFLE